MAKGKAIIDLGSLEELRDALPKDAEVVNRRPLFFVSFGDVQCVVHELVSNKRRWAGVVVGPKLFIAKLQERLDGAKVVELTKELYKARKTQLTALGLPEVTRNGRKAFKLPHVICGQSPWVDIDDD